MDIMSYIEFVDWRIPGYYFWSGISLSSRKSQKKVAEALGNSNNLTQIVISVIK